MGVCVFVIRSDVVCVYVCVCVCVCVCVYVGGARALTPLFKGYYSSMYDTINERPEGVWRFCVFTLCGARVFCGRWQAPVCAKGCIHIFVCG
jgi:hypothetical protein